MNKQRKKVGVKVGKTERKRKQVKEKKTDCVFLMCFNVFLIKLKLTLVSESPSRERSEKMQSRKKKHAPEQIISLSDMRHFLTL